MKSKKILLQSNLERSGIKFDGVNYEISGLPMCVDNAVMNGVYYPADANAAAMNTMIGRPVTLSHPTDKDGNFISANAGEGLRDHFSGGTITRTYNVDGLWKADATIKKSILEAQDGGDVYINMLENAEIIGTSTGLFMEDNADGGEAGGVTYNKTAHNQQFDHLALLSNEAPAGGDATTFTAQFNSQVDVVNIDQFIEHSSEESLIDRIFNAVKSKFNANEKNSYNDSGNKSENNDGVDPMRDFLINKLGLDDDVSDEALQAAADKALAANSEQDEKGITLADVTAAVNAAVKPLQDQIAANAETELKGLREEAKALKVNGVTESVIDKMDKGDLESFVAANQAQGFGAFNAHRGEHKPESFGVWSDE